MSFKPIQKEHYFSKYGTWLSNVTKVIPSEPSTYKKAWIDFTEHEANQHMDKCGVLSELPLNKDKVSLERVVEELLHHFEVTGVLEGILLPFEQQKSSLTGVKKHHVRNVWLNYGDNGQGGQRNPKPRHVLHMLRKWHPDKLTCGSARLDPTDGRVYVNEGQQRSIAGCLVGRTEFAYEILTSSDEVYDLFQFKTENQNKLRASDVEIALSDALQIKKELEPYCDKKKIDITDISYPEVCAQTKLTIRDDEYLHFKIFNELSLKRNYRIVNDENDKEKHLKGSCSNISQLKEIFQTPEYTDDILGLALDWYEYIWPKRRLETADLIGLLETIYFNKEWLFQKDFDIEIFKVRLMTALRAQWPDGKSGKGGVPSAWSGIQEVMKEQFPYKTKEEKEANVKFYSVDSTRIAKHMWLGQGFYSVLTQRMPKEYADKFVQPYTVESKMVFDLQMPCIING